MGRTDQEDDFMYAENLELFEPKVEENHLVLIASWDKRGERASDATRSSGLESAMRRVQNSIMDSWYAGVSRCSCKINMTCDIYPLAG